MKTFKTYILNRENQGSNLTEHFIFILPPKITYNLCCCQLANDHKKNKDLKKKKKEMAMGHICSSVLRDKSVGRYRAVHWSA